MKDRLLQSAPQRTQDIKRPKQTSVCASATFSCATILKEKEKTEWTTAHRHKKNSTLLRLSLDKCLYIIASLSSNVRGEWRYVFE
jgi:hypothetical protein